MRSMKNLSALLLAMLLTMQLALPVHAVAAEQLESAVSGTAAYVLRTVPSPQVSSIGGEWAVIGLARSGSAVPDGYFQRYYEAVEAQVTACRGVLHQRKYTEYARVILALTAIGKDPAQVAGYNLLTPLGDFDKTVWQGINGPIWALIALDAGNYPMPKNSGAGTQATRQMYVDELLARQLPDGGWSLTGKGSADPDVTGMALQALANYQSQTAVKDAVQRALTCLSALQGPDGGYAASSGSSESVVQVLVALCELGISMEDDRFIKNGHTLLDALLSYRLTDGSFAHTASGGGDSQMATEQGLYGLAAALRAATGQPSLYRMTDVASKTSADLSGKHPDVKSVPVTLPGVTFSDLSSESRAAVEALASRGILNGVGNGRFAPEASMTRAAFAILMVRALGLTPSRSGTFTDVDNAAWYAPYIDTAARYGIIRGVGDGRFDPTGTITRQQAAVMTARAAVLCGMDTTLDNSVVERVLAELDDGGDVGSWARPSMAFCRQVGLLTPAGQRIEPQRAIRRGEAAQMLYELLRRANLV